MEFNRLFLQNGCSLNLYKDYCIYHPILKDIVGLCSTHTENTLYDSYVSILTTTSLDIADLLWVENKIWYEEIKEEFDFFLEKTTIESRPISLYKIVTNNKEIPYQTIIINKEISDALNFFLKLDLTYAIAKENNHCFIVSVNKIHNELYYYDDNSFRFTGYYYEIVKDYIKAINWCHNKDYDVLHGGTKYAKKYILESEYKRRIDDIKKKRKSTVTLDSIVSSLVAKGVRYDDIWNFPIYFIYDLYYRYSQFENWNNTMMALYSGNIDTKKNPINWDKINWSKVIN